MPLAMKDAFDIATETSFGATDLAVRRGGRLLFEGVNFVVRPGDALILAGLNGSGKSSLLRLLAGFGRPATGRLCRNGVDIAKDLDAARADLHLLAHADAIKPALTAGELLQFWTVMAGGDAGADNIARALGALGLAALAETPCRLLSSGQRRRLALARLLTTPRRLWLLDEPAVGLDAQALAALQALIARHRTAGGMIILSTHQDLGLAAAQTLRLDQYLPRRVLPGAGWAA